MQPGERPHQIWPPPTLGMPPPNSDPASNSALRTVIQRHTSPPDQNTRSQSGEGEGAPLAETTLRQLPATTTTLIPTHRGQDAGKRSCSFRWAGGCQVQRQRQATTLPVDSCSAHPSLIAVHVKYIFDHCAFRMIVFFRVHIALLG